MTQDHSHKEGFLSFAYAKSLSGRFWQILEQGFAKNFDGFDRRGIGPQSLSNSITLIEIGREKDSKNAIDYRVADLSQRLHEFEGKFDHIGSHLALNDVEDYRGFAATLASLVKPEGRIVLAFNNPYSLVVRGHITDYFESGARGLYGGLSQLGIPARSYHRTLEEYLDAFLGSGLKLLKLVDVLQDRLAREWLLPSECRFPLFMILAFKKPGDVKAT